jgi:hypothetical protein
MNLFDLVEKIGEPYEQVVEFEELVRGDLIEFQEGERIGENAVVIEKECDGAVVMAEDGVRIWVGVEPQFALRKAPDELEDWLIMALESGGPVRGFLMLYHCWNKKCADPGWALFLHTPFDILITDGSSIFRYPGVRRQLGEYLATRSDVRAAFGRVKERFSKTLGRKYLSQGCPCCDGLWGDHPLRQRALAYFGEWQGLPNDVDDSRLKYAFTIDPSRLFEESTSHY